MVFDLTTAFLKELQLAVIIYVVYNSTLHAPQRRTPVPFFKSFPEESEIGDIYRFEPRIWNHFRQFSRELLHGPSPLTPGERELIAGFVSGLNACEFCHGSHTAAATVFGFSEDVMPELLNDIDTATVDDKLKPILR